MNSVDAKDQLFPDGSVIGKWFQTTEPVSSSGVEARIFNVVEYGVDPCQPDLVQTENIQKVIDLASASGGGEIRFPAGRYLSGSLFFKAGTSLHLESGAELSGSQEIGDFALLPTRIEGENVTYFAALINAENCDNFRISGGGVICGCGEPYWRHFWLRRKFNPACTNMDEMRPRLLYVSHSSNVHISGVTLKDSPFWSSHYYRCDHLKLIDLTITAPYQPIPSPSTDGIDLDCCSDVLISGCHIAVNDDAIALKGGKGPDADKLPENGGNQRIIIENCRFGHCMSILTCGSETVHNSNIVLRNCEVEWAYSLLFLKMRPDTPQLNEFIRLYNISGWSNSILYAYSWTQFRRSEELYPGYGRNIELENLRMSCSYVCDIAESGEYGLEDIRIKDSVFTAEHGVAKAGSSVKDVTFSGVRVNDRLFP